MPNWCSVSIHLKFATPEDGKAYAEKIDRRVERNGRLEHPLNIGAERLLFDSERFSDTDGVEHINGEVKWAFERDDFVGVVKDAGDKLVWADCRYCEEGNCIKGVYGWTREHPDQITDKYIAEKDWPELDDDADTDSDEVWEEWARRLDEVLEKSETHKYTFAEVEQQRVARERWMEEVTATITHREPEDAKED